MSEAGELRGSGPVDAPARIGVALVAGDEGPDRDELSAELARIGYEPRPLALSAVPPPDAALVVLVLPGQGAGAVEDAIRFAQGVRGSPAHRETPIVWAVPAGGAERLPAASTALDDFVELPCTRPGLAARLRLARRRAGQQDDDEVLRRGSLVLNLSTYQATAAGRRLDLTYMEYRLLRFLAANPGRVHTREAILSNVWGYDYYGGIRTVDVHVRRLRVKLGQEHARLIETVRSVGYRFSTESV